MSWLFSAGQGEPYGSEGRPCNLTLLCGSPSGDWEATVFKYVLQAAKNPGVILPLGTRVTVT